jgi:hypothetical protein
MRSKHDAMSHAVGMITPTGWRYRTTGFTASALRLIRKVSSASGAQAENRVTTITTSWIALDQVLTMVEDHQVPI